jgi:tRNA pseudouridine55 synthase
MPDRIILINKPYTWTSFDVVKKLKKPLLDEKRTELPEHEAAQIKKLKVGHAGTLDPLATGLLVICSGKLTKKISEIQDAEKEYTGTLTLGAETESYDLESEPNNFLAFEHLTEEQIRKEAAGFLGTHLQKPPIHSAKKVAGKRAYEKARKGDSFELKQNEITLSAFDITAIRLPEVDFRVVCSKGTYIRSLAHELGQRLGVGAYLSALCRTRIGDYRLENALSPLEFINQLAEQQRVK